MYKNKLIDINILGGSAPFDHDIIADNFYDFFRATKIL